MLEVRGAGPPPSSRDHLVAAAARPTFSLTNTSVVLLVMFPVSSGTSPNLKSSLREMI